MGRWLSIICMTLLLIRGSLSGAKLLGIHINSEVWVIFVLIFLSHVSLGSSASFILVMLLLANRRQVFRASKSLWQQKLLCIMMWFLDELFHNLCNERMNCCLIYVRSEWRLSIYCTALDHSVWIPDFTICCAPLIFG